MRSENETTCPLKSESQSGGCIMRFKTIRNTSILGTCLAAMAVATPAMADDAADAADAASAVDGEAIVVTGTRATYNNSALSEELIADKPPVASVLDQIGSAHV